MAEYKYKTYVMEKYSSICGSGNVQIKHHSTSSLFEVTINTQEEVEQGTFEDKKEVLWLDYTSFENLKKCMNIIN